MNKVKTHTSKFLKPLLLLAGVLGVLFSGYGQGGFSKLYAEGLGTSPILYDHPYILTAAQSVNSNGYRNVIFMKMDANGQLLDTSFLSADSASVYAGLQNAMIRVGDHYIAVGRRTPEAMLVKLDTNLNILDTVFFQIGGEWSSALSVAEAQNHDLLIAGTIYWTDSVLMQRRKGYLCARFDEQLNPKWIRKFHTASVNGKLVEQQAQNIMEDSRGNIWLGGYQQNLDKKHSGNNLILGLDSTGNKVFEQVYGDTSFEEGTAVIIEAPDSNYLIVSSIGQELAQFAGETGTKGKVRIYKIDEAGTIIWDRVYGPNRLTNFITDAEILNSNEIILSGYYIDSEVHDSLRDAIFRSYAFKTNFNGDSLWYREYIAGTYQSDWNRLYDIDATPDGGFVAGGHFLSTTNSPLTGSAGSHVWIVRADSFGCVVQGCQNISIAEEEPVSRISLYPNPTKGTFQLEGLEGIEAELKIYNSSGQEVLHQPAVHEKQSIQLHHQPAGLYMVQVLQKGKVLYSTKLLLQP